MIIPAHMFILILKMLDLVGVPDVHHFKNYTVLIEKDLALIACV